MSRLSSLVVGLAPADRMGPGRKRYALILLLLIYISNFIDRTIVGIVAQPMKEDLGLADWQLGLIGGLAFALFYTGMGLPIARAAERRSRVAIISLSLLAWSGFTALCGFTQNFSQLLLARVGVGVGEAGCTPAAQSLISDLYPPHQRPMAMSVYGLGIPLGVLFGAVLGGWISQHLGWRQAFVLVGAPGVLLAALAWVTLREPARGGLDPAGGAVPAAPAFPAVVKLMWASPVLVHVILGAGLASFGGFSVQAFAVPFLLRGFEIPLSQASTAFGLIAGGSAVVGTALGGWLTSRFAPRNPKLMALIPAIGLGIAFPLYAAAFLQRDLMLIALCVVISATVQYFYLGPTYALVNNLVDPRMRATAVAILLLVMNLVGLGLGPTVTGAVSDLIAGHLYGAGFEACVRRAADPACRAASFRGLSFALALSSVAFAWAGLHYLYAARWLRRSVTPQRAPQGHSRRWRNGQAE